MSEHKSAVKEDGYLSLSQLKRKQAPRLYPQEPLDDFASVPAAATASSSAAAAPSKLANRTNNKRQYEEKEKIHTHDGTPMDDDADDHELPGRSHPRRTVKKTQTFVPGASQFVTSEATQPKGKAPSSSSSSKKPKKSKAASQSDSGTYRGEGFTVRDHTWYNQAECHIKYAVPPIENIDYHYRRISCEEACRVSGYQVSRTMIVDLEPSNVAKLNAALSSDKEMGETDKLVLQMCDSGETNKCALYQSDPNDIDSIKVVTTKFIRSGEPVAIYMGRLVELSQFEAEYGDRLKYNLSSYEIHPDALPADYVKSGGVPLMLDTNMYVNEAKFIRDPLWDDHEVSANVQCRIVWNHARGLPYVAMIALGNIAQNVELLVNWGETAWSAHARLKLHRMAHQSHRMHFRLKQLYELIEKEGVDKYKKPHDLRITDDVPFENFHYAKPNKSKHNKEEHKSEVAATASSSSSSAAAAILSSYSASSQRSQVVPLPEGMLNRYRVISRKPDAKTTPTFILRNTPHVFENCQVKLFKNCDYSALEPEVLAAWKSAGARFAPPISSLKPALKTVLQTGRCPKTAVYEVVSLRHPARFYSPPDCAIYSMLARKTIEKHEPIGVYVGKIFEKERFHGDYDPEDRIKQVYAYDMSTDLFEGLEEKLGKPNSSKSSLKVSDLPSLVCESLSVGGNETRFINDSWCRIGGSDCKNAEALPMFNPLNGNLPVMIIRATRTIRKGQEIVTDYGETFWNKISTALCMEHSAYHAKADKQIREVEQELYEIQQRKQHPAVELSQANTTEVPVLQQVPSNQPSSDESKSSPAAADTAESVTPFLYSTPSPAAAFLPPPPDAWECLRSPFNSWDVKYSHRPYPVRFDPVKHDDPFVREVLASQRAVIAEQQTREKMKAEKAAAALHPEKKPRILKPPPPKIEGARTSSRIAFIHSEEAQKLREQVEQEKKMKQEDFALRKHELREARAAKKRQSTEHRASESHEYTVKIEPQVAAEAVEGKQESSSSERRELLLATWGVDFGVETSMNPPVVETPAESAVVAAESRSKKLSDEIEIDDATRSSNNSSRNSNSGTDSDVIILEGSHLSTTSEAVRKKTMSPAADVSFPCECGEVIASWRYWKGKSFFACLACYLRQQQDQPSSSSNRSPERKRKKIQIDSDEDIDLTEMHEPTPQGEQKEDLPARMEDSDFDEMSLEISFSIKHQGEKRSAKKMKK